MDIPIKIVIIDDKPRDLEVFCTELRDIYGSNSVDVFANSQEGLSYIFKNITKKIIVILDYDLAQNEQGESETGLDILKKIREKTSLLTVLVCTTKPLNEISSKDLKEFINNHVFLFLDKFDEIEKRLDAVQKALNQMSTRLDCAIEEWISLHSPEEINKPYLMTMSGLEYTLNDLLHEIRQKTALGITMERNILQLTIDLLARKKKKLND